MIKRCVVCGAEFEAHGPAKYCSNACWLTFRRRQYADSKPPSACVVCGREVGRARFRQRSVTCSDICWREKKRALARDGWKRLHGKATDIKPCIICGSEFSARTSRHKTCSSKCSREWKLMSGRLRKPSGSRAQLPPILTCISCHESFEAHRRDAKYCSRRCEYAANAEVRRERCRSWRNRHPDRQKASRDRWKENNPERHHETELRRSARYRERHREKLRAFHRQYRDTHPEIDQRYKAARTAAFRLVRLIERYGPIALEDGFMEPAQTLKARDAARRSRERLRDKHREKALRYKADNPDKVREARRRSKARSGAALKIVRELQSKGIEALK